jgi:hypothetical protein
MHAPSASSPSHLHRHVTTTIFYRGADEWPRRIARCTGMLPLVLAATATTVSFVDVVDDRLADSHTLHVVDWWADDLDGDGKLESIAMICEPEHGFFLVQHGNDVLEAPWTVDGRNSCPDPAPRPAFDLRHDGYIAETINVHHGVDHYRLAIRDNRLVQIGTGGHSFDNFQTGREDDDGMTDYDKLRWEASARVDDVVIQHARGVIVLAGETIRRATTIAGRTTVAATRSFDQLTLHIHADGPVTISSSDSDYQHFDAIELGTGDHDVVVAAWEFRVTVGTTSELVRIAVVDADDSYPAPPAA